MFSEWPARGLRCKMCRVQETRQYDRACALDLSTPAFVSIGSRRLHPRKAHVVIEATILLTETVEVPECVVRREVFELHEQVREDFFHGVHELVHEFVHLQLT
jgi:hypothetical protein